MILVKIKNFSGWCNNELAELIKVLDENTIVVKILDKQLAKGLVQQAAQDLGYSYGYLVLSNHYFVYLKDELPHSVDATIWAKEFMKVINSGIQLDEELMISWFSNAIMAGYDAR
jgi:hypothetical protein